MALSRRHFVTGSVGGCLACATVPSWAKSLVTNLEPLVGADYKPSDVDERGMWQSLGRLEEDLASSETVLRAPELHTYTMAIVERLLGRPATDLRVYIVRESSFNASMTTTGMLIVHTGLLVRMRNEAQYAAILGHEAGHYFRKHSITAYRNARTKSSIAAFVTAGTSTVAGYSAMQGYRNQSWIDLAESINQALTASIFRFSREQESEADAYGISLLASSGYPPIAAADVWRQLIEERQQSAAQRDKRYKANVLYAESTHPPSGDRMQNLTDTASVLAERTPPTGLSDRREEWREAISPFQSVLLAEQVKLNDPGSSLYLIDNLARDGWTGVLRFYEGEVYRLRNDDGDPSRAASAYSAAVALADAPAEAWRAHGYALAKSGQRDAARQSLMRYLELEPNATDAAMIRFSIAE